MNSLLENQKVNKRKNLSHIGNGSFFGISSRGNKGFRRSSGASSPGQGIPFSWILFRKDSYHQKFQKPVFNSSGVMSSFRQQSRFIDGIQQHPIRNRFRRYDPEKQSSGDTINFSISRGIKNILGYFFGSDEAETASEPVSFQIDENRGYQYRRPGERPRIRRFPSFPAIPVTALIVLAMGVFFMISGSNLDWLNREVISSEKDQGSQHSLALYAGVTPRESQIENAMEIDIPLDLTETFEWHNYKVVKGDSVSRIAAAFSVSMDAIIASNNITNARTLREGEVLKIPNMDGIPYTVRRGDSLFGISKSMGVPLEAILDANDLQSDEINAGVTLFIPGARMKREDLRMALGELFIYPIKGGRLSSPYGWRDDPISGVRRHHAAIDLSAPTGTPVKAAMEGKVSALGFNMTYGNFIILDHPGGYQTMYAHLHTSTVKKGDQVNQNTQIGTVGSTGYSTGPHLHFAVFRNTRAVNPLDFLTNQK